MGLSTVHVNRMLQELRNDGLITLDGKNLKLHDVDALRDYAEFDPSYLHLQKRTGSGAQGVTAAARTDA